MKHINVGLFVVHEGCPNMCSFCNQRSISGEKKQRITPQDIADAVRTACETSGESTSAGEIAFFGGSFTMIERSYMLELLGEAKKYVDKGLFKGIRISTRPDGIDNEICSILKEYSVTAVELGAQSMRDSVLEANRRGHTAEDVRKASALIHSYGIELGLQMMTGLYTSTDEDDLYTAREFISLCPATVRIYPTVVLESTHLAELMREGLYTPQSVEQAVEICSKLLPMFREKNIEVIRLGLHSGGNVEEGFLAGAYHPALRELCESRIYRNILGEELKGLQGPVTVAVNSKEVSKLTGQKRSNICFFEEKGISIKVHPVDFLDRYQIKVFSN